MFRVSIFTERKCNPNCSKSGASRGQILYAEDERVAHSQCSFTSPISHLDQWQMESYLLLIKNHLFMGVQVDLYQHGCACHMHAPTWTFCKAWVNTSCHPAAHSGGRPVWLFPQSPRKKGRVTDRKNVPGHHDSPPHVAFSPSTLPHNPKPPPTGLTKWLVGD